MSPGEQKWTWTLYEPNHHCMSLFKVSKLLSNSHKSELIEKTCQAVRQQLVSTCVGFSCLLSLQSVLCLTVHWLLPRTTCHPVGRICHFLTADFFPSIISMNILRPGNWKPISQLNGRYIFLTLLQVSPGGIYYLGESFLVASQKTRQLCPQLPGCLKSSTPRLVLQIPFARRRAQGHTQFTVNPLDHTFPSHAQKKVRIFYHKNKWWSQEYALIYFF